MQRQDGEGRALGIRWRAFQGTPSTVGVLSIKQIAE
jgi:hypothetical protein